MEQSHSKKKRKLFLVLHWKVSVQTSTSTKSVCLNQEVEQDSFYHLTNQSTLTDLDSCCPRSLLKTTSLPPEYPLVSGVWYVTPEPRFKGLVIDHQSLEELELKNHPKNAVFFYQIWLFLSGFLVLVLLKVGSGAPNP